MSLILCPECEGPVSDKAPTCPHCGHPLIAAREMSEKTQQASAFIVKQLLDEGKIEEGRLDEVKAEIAQALAIGEEQTKIKSKQADGCISTAIGALVVSGLVGLFAGWEYGLGLIVLTVMGALGFGFSVSTSSDSDS